MSTPAELEAEAYRAGLTSARVEQVRAWHEAAQRMAGEAQDRAGLLTAHPGIEVGAGLGLAGFGTSEAAAADLESAERAAAQAAGFGRALVELEGQGASC